MSDTTKASITATEAQTVVKRHPVRGFLWGLMFGLGLAVVLVITKVINLDLTMMIIVIVLGTLVGIVWSTFGPAKAPKGPPPATVTVAAAPEISRFDDFDAAADEPADDDAADDSADAGDSGDGGDSSD